MSQRFRNPKGFTLVELMITIVIIGVLASAAIPLYKRNVERAKISEADAALGSARTSLRLYHAENNIYPIAASFVAITTLSINIDSTDLSGTYFSPADYTYKSVDGSSFILRVTGTGEQDGIKRQMLSDGTLSNF